MCKDLKSLELELKTAIQRATTGYKLALRPKRIASLGNDREARALRSIYHKDLRFFVPVYRALVAYNQPNHSPSSRGGQFALYEKRVLALLKEAGRSLSSFSVPDFVRLPLWVSTADGGRFVTVREYQAEVTAVRKTGRSLINEFRASLTAAQRELVKRMSAAEVYSLSLVDLAR